MCLSSKTKCEFYYLHICFIFLVVITDILIFFFRHTVFFVGWALKEKQTVNQRGVVKRIKPEIKALMETMFLNGNIDKRKKMSAQDMHNNLMERALHEEIEEEEVPKVSTIQNWIANYTRTFKASASLRALEEAESSKIRE
jgi:hypothetical protein